MAVICVLSLCIYIYIYCIIHCTAYTACRAIATHDHTAQQSAALTLHQHKQIQLRSWSACRCNRSSHHLKRIGIGIGFRAAIGIAFCVCAASVRPSTASNQQVDEHQACGMSGQSSPVDIQNAALNE